MLTVFLSIDRTIFINWLASGERFSSAYFCQQMCEPLSQILHSERATGSSRLTLHFDNATPHRSAGTDNCFQSCQFRHPLQPPYGPDVSSRDFLLFGDLKTKLRAEEFETMGQLQGPVDGLLGQVTSKTVRQACEPWTERPNQVISTNLDYV
jgi:hypothetical protein